ncbi:MAG: putative membrane protein [Ilumatobacter sp.]|jgi:putative membrane protein
MKALLLRMVVLTAAFLIVDAFMGTVTISGGFFGALGLAVVYGLLSAVLGTLLRLLTLPLVFLTVGLFEFVINAVVLVVTDALTDSLEIASFTSALGAAVILSIASVLIGLVISVVLPKGDEQ